MTHNVSMRVASYGKVRLLTALCPRTNTSIANSISSWLCIVEDYCCLSALVQGCRIPPAQRRTRQKMALSAWQLGPSAPGDMDRDRHTGPLSGLDRRNVSTLANRRQGEKAKRKVSLVSGHLTGLEV